MLKLSFPPTPLLTKFVLKNTCIQFMFNILCQFDIPCQQLFLINYFVPVFVV